VIGDEPLATKLDFLETIDDLMEVEHELSTVGDEEPPGAVET
jgi:hypothetical protein